MLKCSQYPKQSTYLMWSLSKLKSLQITKAWKDVEWGEPYYTVRGNVNWDSHYWKKKKKTWSFLKKNKNSAAIWSNNHTAGHCCCFSVPQSCRTLCNPMDCNKLPCPSPPPAACLNSCPLNQWCHPTISSSVISFSSCL